MTYDMNITFQRNRILDIIQQWLQTGSKKDLLRRC